MNAAIYFTITDIIPDINMFSEYAILLIAAQQYMFFYLSNHN